MIIDYGAAVSQFPAIHAALGCEPAIRLDLSDLQDDKLPLVLLSLMNRGMCTVPAMSEYLDDHGAPFGMEHVLDALDENTAAMGFADMTADGLWYRGCDGTLTPTIGAPD